MADSDSAAPSRTIRVLDRLYACVVASADWLHAHRVAVAIVGAPTAALLIFGINQFVLLDFPNSGDEYAYLYQAQTMAEGRLWNPAPSPPELFTFNYIVQEHGRAFGSFPFGWPLVLALGLRVGLPAWSVNPLLGALTLGLVWWLGARLYSARAGVLAAALIGGSPYFLFNAASYFAHTFCGALLLGAALVAARDDRTPAWVPVLAGLLIGWAVVTRYFTGAFCALPIALWLLRPGVGRARTVALFVAGGLPWALALLAYDEALTGSPWRLTTEAVTFTRWFADGFVLRGADILGTHVIRHLAWTPPALLAAYGVYLGRAPRELRRGALDWVLVLMAAALFFYMERGGNQYGTRFHYEAFLLVVPFVAANLFRATSPGELTRLDRVAFGAVAASVALMPVAFAVHAVIERQVIVERMNPYAEVHGAGLRNALVLIGGRVGTDRSMAARDLTRNGIHYSDSVLYGVDPGEVARCTSRARIPGRATYLYVWDRVTEDGTLRPVACPARPQAARAPAGAAVPPSSRPG
ncbi:MAG: hypothetical protein IT180_01725 [Acidobacteria bacterium]|nr:hypothetical protein [Acidobacteriota bacterium]